MKLQYQLKKKNLTDKKEIGEFCYQFAYDMPINYPQTSKTAKKTKNKNFSRKKKTIPKSRSNNSTRKKMGPKCTTNQETRVCWKCRKIGHLANRCTTKKKLAELNLDEGLKLQLSTLLLNTSLEINPENSDDEI